MEKVRVKVLKDTIELDWPLGNTEDPVKTKKFKKGKVIMITAERAKKLWGSVEVLPPVDDKVVMRKEPTPTGPKTIEELVKSEKKKIRAKKKSQKS